MELQTSGKNRPRSRRLTVVIALMAGVAAGLIAWITQECGHDAFRPRLAEVPKWEAVWMEPNIQTQSAAEWKNASLASALLGCAAGLVRGFAGGVVGRAPSRGIFVGLSAQVGGLLLGALAALIAIPVFQSLTQRSFRTMTTDVWVPLAIRATVWVAAGAVGGAAFALGAGQRSRLGAAVGCATAGALLSAILFQVIAASLPLDAGAAAPVARWPVLRLIAMLFPSTMIAAGAALGTIADDHRSAQGH
jgi:hypothetical protein